MRAMLRHRLELAVRGRQVAAPLTAFAFVLFGVYAYRPNSVDDTFALTALLNMPLCGWFVAAIAGSEPEPSRAAAVAAVGGPGRALRGDVLLAAVVVAVASAILVVAPVAAGAFDRPVRPGDLGAAGLAHVVCGGFGAALADLSSPPVSQRPATAFMVVLGTLLVSAALEPSLGVLGGPVGVAGALASSSPGAVEFSLLTACAATLALTAATVAARVRLVARAG